MSKLMKPRWKAKTAETHRWKIVAGDNVEVTQGPQSGQKGKVIAVLRAANRIIVDGVNMRRRIEKPAIEGAPKRIVTKPCSVHRHILKCLCFYLICI